MATFLCFVWTGMMIFLICTFKLELGRLNKGHYNWIGPNKKYVHQNLKLVCIFMTNTFWFLGIGVIRFFIFFFWSNTNSCFSFLSKLLKYCITLVGSILSSSLGFWIKVSSIPLDAQKSQLVSKFLSSLIVYSEIYK